MKLLLACFLSMLLLQTVGQSGISIQGRISDFDSEIAIADCYVQLINLPFAANSDKQGNFKILSSQPLDSVSIIFTKLNYVSQTILVVVNDEQKKAGVVRLNIQLKFESFQLPEISINATPDTVWGSTALNVADFAFIGKNLLLLTYVQEERWKRQEESKTTLFQQCQLILLDSAHHETMRCSVPEEALKFYVDYLGEIFLLCRRSTFYVVFNDDEIRLEKMDKEQFNHAILPVVDTIGALTYFSNYNADYPAFEYMIYNSADSSVKTFRYMIDEEMMKMFRSEYKYLDPKGKLEALRFEINTGIDKEIVAAYMNGFQNTYYYEALNTPLLLVNDTLVIFDHHHDKLFRFDSNGQSIDSVLIQYHKVKRPDKWGEKITKDKQTQKIYTSYMRNGITFIREINTTSGNVGATIRLQNKYVENLRITDGYVYYIYRPFESSQKRFLYKEHIAEGS